MIIRKLVIFFMMLPMIILAGCAVNDYGHTHTDYNIKGLSIPEIGEISTAEIGDNLYQEFIGSFSATYYVSLDTSTLINVGKAQLNIGSEMRAKRISGKKESTVSKACFSDLKDAPPEEVKIGNTLMWKHHSMLCLSDLDHDGKFEFAEINGEGVKQTYLVEPVSYSIKREVQKQYTRNSFEQIILYQGVVHGVINISYRELKDNMARPAFTQNVQYKLGKEGPTLIAFKGVRIKVLSANNTSIQYRVLEPFRGSILK